MEGLTLEQLRAYRSELRAEEDRVSYWRRLAHGRIDLLTAQATSGPVLTRYELARALSDTGSGRRRSGLMSIEAADPLPELPELDEIWTSRPDPHDAAALADQVARLRAAEEQLTRYRTVLHQRLDEATAELIARYKRDPTCALAVLRQRGQGGRRRG